MINQIIEGITVAIGEEFGDGYNIYVEQIEQDLSEPCFFVACLNPTHELFLGRRYFRQNHFDIQYFPGSDSVQRECNDVAMRLYECLEYITLYDAGTQTNESKPIRGGEMHYEMVDGVMHFFIDYNCFVTKRESDTLMEILEQTTITKDV